MAILAPSPEPKEKRRVCLSFMWPMSCVLNSTVVTSGNAKNENAFDRALCANEKNQQKTQTSTERIFTRLAKNYYEFNLAGYVRQSMNEGSVPSIVVKQQGAHLWLLKDLVTVAGMGWEQ